jgi:uracil-DNA glycosylase
MTSDSWLHRLEGTGSPEVRSSIAVGWTARRGCCCVASNPGRTERIAGWTLLGDAGQRVQGFLAKRGLTRSYLCLNALVYALFPPSTAPRAAR